MLRDRMSWVDIVMLQAERRASANVLREQRRDQQGQGTVSKERE